MLQKCYSHAGCKASRIWESPRKSRAHLLKPRVHLPSRGRTWEGNGKATFTLRGNPFENLRINFLLREL